MPTIEPSACHAGDVVLFYGLNLVSTGLAAARVVKGVTVLPAVVSAARGGSTAFVGNATANHAGVVCGRAPGWDLAHATSEAGVAQHDLAALCRGGRGTLQVFRMMATPLIAAAAGAVARTWATTDRQDVGMKFANAKAGMCAFRSSSYGSGARSRAALYRAEKDRRGGPQDWKNLDRETHKGMFCSMFAIACYQAVMDDATTEQTLALDAKATSPMYLDGYLRNSPLWYTVGALGVG